MIQVSIELNHGKSSVNRRLRMKAIENPRTKWRVLHHGKVIELHGGKPCVIEGIIVRALLGCHDLSGKSWEYIGKYDKI